MASTVVSKSVRPKKYRCEEKGCGKAYSRPCLLNQHIRTHSNERPFTCNECGKSFFRDSHLRVHLWTHSDDKPLKCTVCSKGFVTSQQLSRHMKTHPLEFKCPYECDEAFLSEKELSEHMLATHIMNDIVDVDTHQNKSEELVNLLKTQLDYPNLSDIPDFQIYNQPQNFWTHWDNHQCKEPNCQGYPIYKNYQDLIFHYDEFHQFVPQTLFEAFESSPSEESTGTSDHI